MPSCHIANKGHIVHRAQQACVVAVGLFKTASCKPRALIPPFTPPPFCTSKGIKAIKLYSYEGPYVDRITQLRCALLSCAVLRLLRLLLP